MNKLKELLRSFPEYWQTDDESVPVLIMRYPGTSCWVKIENDVFEIVPSESDRVVIQLDQVIRDELTNIPHLLTINELVALVLDAVPNLQIEIISGSFHNFYDGTLRTENLDNIWRTYPNIWTNYPLPVGHTTAQVGDLGWYLNIAGVNRPLMVPGVPTSIGELAAVMLTDVGQDIVTNQVLGAPTNLIWPLLKPLARLLRRGEEYGDALTSQIDLRSVDGPWLTRWGEIYGVERIYPENDVAFRNRLVSTTFKPRISPTSIEMALTNAFGFGEAEVSDDTGIPYGFLVQFYAVQELAHYFGKPTRDLIDLYRAAGTSFKQTGIICPPVETVSRPVQTFRMRRFNPDGSILGFESTEDGPWGVDLSTTTIDLGTVPALYGGRMYGETTFG